LHLQKLGGNSGMSGEALSAYLARTYQRGLPERFNGKVTLWSAWDDLVSALNGMLDCRITFLCFHADLGI
jgi:hypothetical protein